MSIALITGAAGLVGAEAARLFAAHGLDVVGIDNDMRQCFFGADASTAWSRRHLERDVRNYRHYDADIRNSEAINAIFARYGSRIAVVIHTAAQPSHDWAARAPEVDFSINAVGTLKLLEAVRRHCPDASFIFTSTNKVYGDAPNHLPLVENETRWELAGDHPYAAEGIDEAMSVDQCMHSLFGVSKLAADALVQEYGRYFGLYTACFRGGCLTGPGHSGVMLHGFLAYLIRCAVTGSPYTVIGYKGKQVRDNIHAHDLANAFWHFFRSPRRGEVYNIGGGRSASCSVLEAIELAERMVRRSMVVTYSDESRMGDHIWWITDTRRFRSHFPDWSPAHDLESTAVELTDALRHRFSKGNVAAPGA